MTMSASVWGPFSWSCGPQTASFCSTLPLMAAIVKLAVVAGFDDNYLHRRMRRQPAAREL